MRSKHRHLVTALLIGLLFGVPRGAVWAAGAVSDKPAVIYVATMIGHLNHVASIFLRVDNIANDIEAFTRTIQEDKANTVVVREQQTKMDQEILRQSEAYHVDGLQEIEEEATQHLNVLESHLAGITGPRQVGPAPIVGKNNALSLNAVDVLHAASTGSTPAQNHPELRLPTDLTTFAERSNAQDRYLALQAATGILGVSTASNASEWSESMYRQLGQLKQRIAVTADVKESVDLNSAVLAHVALIVAEDIRVEAVSAYATSVTHLSRARDGDAKMLSIREGSQ
jgi:type IV secretion system protein VirB5